MSRAAPPMLLKVAAAAADSGRTLLGAAILNADTLLPLPGLPAAAGLTALPGPSRDSPGPAAARPMLLLLSPCCLPAVDAAAAAA